MPQQILTHRFAAGSPSSPLNEHPRVAHFLADLQRTCPRWWFEPPRLARPDRGCVEGWLVAPQHAFDLYAAFNLALWPLPVQVALGGAVLAPSIAPHFAYQNFGRDLPGASQFLEQAQAPFYVHASHRSSEELALVNLAASQYRSILDRWTERQAEVVRLRHDLGGAAKVARRLRISEQSARRILVRARVASLRRIEIVLGAWLRARLHVSRAVVPQRAQRIPVS